MSCIFEMSLPLCKGCTTRRDCWCCDKIGDWIRDRIGIEQHGDLISRSALLDAMRDTEFTTYFPLDEIDSVIDCAPTVGAVQVVRCRDCDNWTKMQDSVQPKWINVEERLPDYHGNFLTKIHCDKGDWIEVDTFDHTEKEWWHDTGNRVVEATEFVTHWMPMPITEPPND